MANFLKIATLLAGRAIVDPQTGNPRTDFLRALNDSFSNISSVVNQIKDQADNIELSLQRAGIALTTAQEVQAELAAKKRADSLTISYVDPTAILSSDVDPNDETKRTITIDDHSRIYGDGQTVEVTGATLAGLDQGTLYFIYYIDVDRMGSTDGRVVSYIATQNAGSAVQSEDRHTVGSITTSGAATDNGDGTYTPPPPTDGGGTTGPGIPNRESGYSRVQEQ